MLIGVVLVGATPLRSDANEFVGVLGLALEEEVAMELGLSDATRSALRDLVDQRESEAIEIAYELRELAPDEQAKQLAPFRARSEQLGLALLTDQQRDRLDAIRIGRLGMPALAEPKVAEAIRLTRDQQTEVQRLLDELHNKSKGLDRRSVAAERKKYELQLKALLTEEQSAMWRQLAGPQVADAGQAKRAPVNKSGRLMTAKPNAAKSAGNGKMRFSFRYAPWSEVIEWFADQAGLSLVMDAPPHGTLNYSDSREYTPAQAIDLLNSVLLTKGYTLVRRDQMLMVINLEDGIPPSLVTEVPVDQLDDRGEYELVWCLFTLRSADAKEVEQEIARLIGPQGSVSVLDASNQLLVTETAGRLRTFRKIIEAAERNSEVALGNATMVTLRQVRAQDVISAWRKLMGLDEQENATPDGSLRVAEGKSSRELIVSGQQQRVDEFKELARLLDAPAAGGAGGIDAPQMEVYPVTHADPTSVLEVMQTLLGDDDEVRLASDPKTGNLVALARPEQHRTIRATIDQMQQDRREVEVIRLRLVDPQLAMMSIEKLFGPVEGEESVDPNAPRVDADLTHRSLLVRGSSAQVAEIRALLAKMGEGGTDGGDRSLGSGRGNLRMLPVDAATARRALDQMNNLWPAVRKNTIRVVSPSSSIRRLRPAGEARHEAPASPPPPLDNNTTSNLGTSHYVANAQDDDLSNEHTSGNASDPADVIVTLGERGVLIASEDLEALDDFEQVFRTLTDRLFSGSRELVVFYLKYTKAEVASELVKQFLGGGRSSSSSGGGSLLGTLAGAALGGGDGGGLVGSLLGMGGGGASSTIAAGTSIVADPRLNALVVQATPRELDFIEQFLKVLDTSAGPEVIETIPKPRTIPVLNTSAEEIAEVVRSVYAGRLRGRGSTPRQPSPEEFIRAMSGQKNTGRNIKDAVSDQLQMTISVDQRRNALIVVAPDSLFFEVKTLVDQLDFATPQLQETIRYGQTSTASPELIRSAVASIVTGESDAQANKADKAVQRRSEETPSQPSPVPSPEQIKRRLEFIKAIQRANAQKKDARAPIRKPLKAK